MDDIAAPIAPQALNRTSLARTIATVVSISLAALGEILLLRVAPNNPQLSITQAMAGILTAAGAIVFGVASRSGGDKPASLEQPNVEDAPRPRSWYYPAPGVGLALIAAAAAILIFVAKGEGPVVIGLWFGGIVMLLSAQLWRRDAAWSAPRAATWQYTLLLGIILVVYLYSRLYHLSTLPYNLDGDFADVGLQARALLAGGQHIFGFGWAEIPMLGYLPPTVSMMLFGDGVAGMNASGVIQGFLTVLGLYWIGRDLFNARVGLLSAALFVISYASLAGTRQATYFDPVLYMVFSVYLLLLGLRRSQGWAIVASGILTAFCTQLYYSGRLLLPILGFLALYLLVSGARALWAKRGLLLLWLLAVLIALGPMLVVFARNTEALMVHTREVFILSPPLIAHTEGVYHVGTVPAMLWEQARRSILFFNYYSDTGTQFGFTRPFLDPVTAPLFFLGLGLALTQFRRIGAFLMLTWLITGVVTGVFLTGNPPFWARLMVLLPPVMILAGLALEAIFSLLADWLERIPRLGAVMAFAIVAALLLIVGSSNWSTYIKIKGNYAEARARIGRYLAAEPPTTRAYLVSSGDWFVQDRIFRFLAPGIFVGKLTPYQAETGFARVGSPTILIFTPEQAPLVTELQQRFASSVADTGVGNSPGEVAFYALRIP